MSELFVRERTRDKLDTDSRAESVFSNDTGLLFHDNNLKQITHSTEQKFEKSGNNILFNAEGSNILFNGIIENMKKVSVSMNDEPEFKAHPSRISSIESLLPSSSRQITPNVDNMGPYAIEPDKISTSTRFRPPVTNSSPSRPAVTNPLGSINRTNSRRSTSPARQNSLLVPRIHGDAKQVNSRFRPPVTDVQEVNGESLTPPSRHRTVPKNSPINKTGHFNKEIYQQHFFPIKTQGTDPGTDSLAMRRSIGISVEDLVSHLPDHSPLESRLQSSSVLDRKESSNSLFVNVPGLDIPNQSGTSLSILDERRASHFVAGGSPPNDTENGAQVDFNDGSLNFAPNISNDVPFPTPPTVTPRSDMNRDFFLPVHPTEQPNTQPKVLDAPVSTKDADMIQPGSSSVSAVQPQSSLPNVYPLPPAAPREDLKSPPKIELKTPPEGNSPPLAVTRFTRGHRPARGWTAESGAKLSPNGIRQFVPSPENLSSQATHAAAPQVRRTEIEKLECGICKKLFSTPASRTRHMRIHSDERPYSCQYCEKSFRQNAHLKKHIRLHTGEKPHACPHCDKRFTQKSTLTGHVRTRHTKETPIACNTCDARFPTRNHLRAHKSKCPGNIKVPLFG
mmetsp:Transcript_5958/g.14428  ORF Transcript_5958/g.14428 Transcript_5958/m.14428 type:complete len:620 (-) Transcript_5958:106-1965(-)